jgi:hypothetical protein
MDISTREQKSKIYMEISINFLYNRPIYWIMEAFMKNKAWTISFWILLCIQIITALYFCYEKKGFHEDEYYSYYSTSRTYGLSVPDGDWMGHDDYYNEFVVLEGQGFQYGLVKLVQSWDVHPPLYYWVLHTICSLFKRQFSKWFGLAINLVAFIISMILLRSIVFKLTSHNERLALIICGFYGFSPAIMSMIVFIRMYTLLTVFIYLCVLLHLEAITSHNINKLLIPIGVVTYLGFLTQYYYFIFIFFMGLSFCIYLLIRDKNLYNCIKYAVSVGISFILCYITYPACLGQMFRGQRGGEATSNFFDLSNTLTRFKYFWDIMDDYVFGGFIWVFIILTALLIVIAILRKISLKPSAQYCVLLFALVGYFIAVSKTALMLGNSSVRYETPIYGLVVTVAIIAIYSLLKRCGVINKASVKNVLYVPSLAICIAISISGLVGGKVLFLYPEASDRVAFSEEQAKLSTPVVYIYDSSVDWCIWASADELFSYPEVYFVSQDSDAFIEDDIISTSRELVVYIAKNDNETVQLERIMSSNTNINSYELKFEEAYCDVYYLN